eukprot:scaffold8649_cov185-Amphora_coffeaeformis.AAC.9
MASCRVRLKFSAVVAQKSFGSGARRTRWTAMQPMLGFSSVVSVDEQFSSLMTGLLSSCSFTFRRGCRTKALMRSTTADLETFGIYQVEASAGNSYK